jgi:uncharacterized protein (DUF952 family)
MSNPKAKTVFKVATRAAWNDACREGRFHGSPHDLRDGFIHLSALHQLSATLAKHFKGQTDLVLVTLDAGALGDALQWERARDDDLFPHLYAALPTTAARAVCAIELDGGGVPVVPEDVWQC